MTQPHYIDRDSVVSALGAELTAYADACAEARTWGGPTIYPPHPITEARARELGKALSSRPAPMEAVAWREKAQIVTEWLAMARETPKPLHSSLNYVPVSPSEFEALEAILQAMRGA